MFKEIVMNSKEEVFLIDKWMDYHLYTDSDYQFILKYIHEMEVLKFLENSYQFFFEEQKHKNFSKKEFIQLSEKIKKKVLDNSKKILIEISFYKKLNDYNFIVSNQMEYLLSDIFVRNKPCVVKNFLNNLRNLDYKYFVSIYLSGEYILYGLCFKTDENNVI